MGVEEVVVALDGDTAVVVLAVMVGLVTYGDLLHFAGYVVGFVMLVIKVEVEVAELA